MTDRELLELAAKAARIEEHPFFSGSYASHEIETDNDMGASIKYPRVWNPLNNDGDSLRLAARLHINIDYCRKAGEVCAYVQHCLGTDICGYHSHQVDVVMTEVLGKDPMIATRRAIVRVAVEIQLQKEKDNERTRN